MLKKGFTLIEMLIVIGIISLLVAMEGFIYVNSQRSARDGKRKSDLENIRAALEQYRSTNNSYPASLAFNPSCTPNGSLNDGSNTYMNPLPSDPRCQLYHYYYSATCPPPLGICNDYTLGARLEQTSTAPCGSCGSGSSCNYCLGPYGTK